MKKSAKPDGFYFYGKNKLHKKIMNFETRKKHAKLLIEINNIVNPKLKENENEINYSDIDKKLSDWIHDNLKEIFETFIAEEDLKYININWADDLNYAENIRLGNLIITDFFGLRRM